jgi:hypothetical protein
MTPVIMALHVATPMLHEFDAVLGVAQACDSGRHRCRRHGRAADRRSQRHETDKYETLHYKVSPAQIEFMQPDIYAGCAGVHDRRIIAACQNMVHRMKRASEAFPAQICAAIAPLVKICPRNFLLAARL